MRSQLQNIAETRRPHTFELRVRHAAGHLVVLQCEAEVEAGEVYPCKLTRSFRAPTAQNLIARPSLSRLYPDPQLGSNSFNSPDRAGNPKLKPEFARGLELSYEKYLGQFGLLSANAFYRQINDMIRTQRNLETVSWSPFPRWVARPQNFGQATTQGIELEARGPLGQWLTGQPAETAPQLDLRANFSAFTSRYSGTQLRMEGQPRQTMNLGLDYRFSGMPLRVGGNLNYTPGSRTHSSMQGERGHPSIPLH